MVCDLLLLLLLDNGMGDIGERERKKKGDSISTTMRGCEIVDNISITII